MVQHENTVFFCNLNFARFFSDRNWAKIEKKDNILRNSRANFLQLRQFFSNCSSFSEKFALFLELRDRKRAAPNSNSIETFFQCHRNFALKRHAKLLPKYTVNGEKIIIIFYLVKDVIYVGLWSFHLSDNIIMYSTHVTFPPKVFKVRIVLFYIWDLQYELHKLVKIGHIVLNL